MSQLCACLEAWIRKLLWPRRPTGTIDAPMCSSLEERAHMQCEEHSSIRASSWTCVLWLVNSQWQTTNFWGGICILQQIYK